MSPTNLDHQLSHAVCYQGLGAHEARKWGARTLVRTLKRAALFYGNVVIPDSDLNNSRLFWYLTDHACNERHELIEALESGFLLRAARHTGRGDVLSQAEVFATFQKNNPKLAARVPEHHVGELDRLLKRVERKYPPVPLDLTKLSPVFRDRLLVALASKTWDDIREPDERRAAVTVTENLIRYLEGFIDEANDLYGAVILRDFLRKTRGSADAAAKKQIAEMLTQAYSGNMPAAFDGKILLRVSESPTVPTGPGEATAEEGLPTADGFAGIDIAPKSTATVNIAYRLNGAALDRLSFGELMRLREPAEHPDGFFDVRFRVLESPRALAAGRAELDGALHAYLDHLAASSAVARPVRSANARWLGQQALVQRRLQGEARAVDIGLVLAFLGILTMSPILPAVMMPLSALLAGGQLIGLARQSYAILEAKQHGSGPISDDEYEQWELVESFLHARRQCETIGRPDYQSFTRAREQILTGRISPSVS